MPKRPTIPVELHYVKLGHLYLKRYFNMGFHSEIEFVQVPEEAEPYRNRETAYKFAEYLDGEVVTYVMTEAIRIN